MIPSTTKAIMLMNKMNCLNGKMGTSWWRLSWCRERFQPRKSRLLAQLRSRYSGMYFAKHWGWGPNWEQQLLLGWDCLRMLRNMWGSSRSKRRRDRGSQYAWLRPVRFGRWFCSVRSRTSGAHTWGSFSRNRSGSYLRSTIIITEAKTGKNNQKIARQQSNIKIFETIKEK